MWRKEDGMEERGELESWERRNDEIEGVGKEEEQDGRMQEEERSEGR